MTDIEILAISKIQSMVALCPRLKALIDSNDKTPLTDGSIDLYKGVSRVNADLVGRVPVQVKGRSASRSGSRVDYTIPRSDLEALRQLGGVLYFVVFVDGLGQPAPYYVILSPFTIDGILHSSAKSKKSARVTLRALPTEVAEIEGIVGIALATRKQQFASFNGQGFERISSFTIKSVRELDLSAPLTISADTGDFALEVMTIDGFSLALPGELTIYPPSYQVRELQVDVVAGSVSFDRPAVRQIGPDQHEVKLSEHLIFTMHVAGGQVSSNVSLTLANNLRDRAKDIDFYLALVDTNTITFQDTKYEFKLSGFADIDRLRAHRKYLGALLELFQALDVRAELILLEDIDEDQLERLRYIHASIVNGANLNAPDGRIGTVLEKIGQWRLLLLVFAGSKPNTWRYVDPFNPKNRESFKIYRTADGGDTTEWPVTVYEGVETSDLPTILNLRVGSVVDAYQQVKDDADRGALANLRVLALIASADACAVRKAELLGAARALNEWIIRDAGSTDAHLINRWQIDVRTTGLAPEQRQEIRETRRRVVATGPDQARELETSCAILLGDTEDIEECMNRLETEEREAMQRWPIWQLRPESLG